MHLGDEDLTIGLFDGHPVRYLWRDGTWYYAMIDIIMAVTDSKRPRQYWNDLKHKLREMGSEILDQIVPYKIPLEDGRLMRTECGDMHTVLRVIQSVPSKRAEPFKIWLAEVGAEQAQATDFEKRAEYRRRLAQVNGSLMKTVSLRGILTKEQRARFRDFGYMGLYPNWSRADLIDQRELIPGDEEADFMPADELAYNMFKDALTDSAIKRHNLQGEAALNQQYYDVGVEVRLTIERVGGKMPEEYHRAKRLSRGDYMPELAEEIDEGEYFPSIPDDGVEGQ